MERKRFAAAAGETADPRAGSGVDLVSDRDDEMDIARGRAAKTMATPAGARRGFGPGSHCFTHDIVLRGDDFFVS